MGRTKGGLNSKLRAVCDGQGRPLVMLLTEVRTSDSKSAALMFDERGYDADWVRNALIAKGIAPCIPSKANRNIPIPHDRIVYRHRHLPVMINVS